MRFFMKQIFIVFLFLLIGCRNPNSNLTDKSYLLEEPLRHRQMFSSNTSKLKDIFFSDRAFLELEGSSVDSQIGKLNGYYCFQITGLHGTYPVLGKNQLIKRKREFYKLFSVRKKTGIDYVVSGMVDSGKGLGKAVGSMLIRPDKILGSLFKVLSKPKEAIDLNNFYSDSDEKRKIAQKLNLDVYSRNPEVQSFLNNTAEKYQRGKLLTKTITLAGLGTPVGFVASTGGVYSHIKNDINALSPKNIIIRVKKELTQMGCTKTQINRFLSNQYLNPGMSIKIMYYIKELKDVAGGLYYPLKLINKTNNYLETKIILEQLKSLALFNQKQHISKIFAIKNLLAFRPAKTRIPTIYIPYDIFEFNQKNKELIIKLKSKSILKSELYCHGKIDDKMKRFLEENGIIHKEK